ncbi:MAG: helix-turn-helix transcriptional regulator [Clostridia bacterium]|nr:helix-turn-helix transcriptional regulator [Clostridia bacterium]
MARIIDGNQMNMVGNQVKKFRKAKKMSQQTLSNKLELMGVYVCRGSVSRIEEKSRTVTDIELYALATVLGVTVNELYDTTGFEHFLE